MAPNEQKHHERLDFISPRMTRRIERARDDRNTEITRKLRRWLPLTAGFIILLLFVWPWLRPDFNLRDIAKNAPDLVIDNLNYSGMDDKNQPYSLTAAQATRPSGTHGLYDMVKPEGEITLQDGVWLAGKSDFGRFDTVQKRLWLGGNVHFFHSNGVEFIGDEAQINIGNKEAWGDKPMMIKGNFGVIRGTGFQFMDGGKTMIVKGPATAVLSLHGGQDSDKQSR